MSGGEPRRVSRQDIQLVQNLIERCLQLYMNQKEVVLRLSEDAKIEPGFTELVWQKLEEENREFFKAYHVRLMLKQQIIMFNDLLEQQFDLMRKIPVSGVSTLPYSNGSPFAPLQQAPCFAMDPTLASSRSLHPSVLNGSASMQHPHQVLHGPKDISSQMGRLDYPINALHSPQIGMINEMNRMAIKSEPCYSNNPVFTFGAEGNVLDTQSPMGGASFSHGESNSHSVNDSSLLEVDTPSYGFLGQIPRNFSLSDLTAGLSENSEILESYTRSPFLPDGGSFLDSPSRGCQDETNRLDTISEAVSHDDFTSD